jgi:SAM-dependent methyltransferase
MRPHKANNFTGYMQKAVEHFAALPAGQELLDIPAGNGQVTDALRRAGHRVVPADINLARPDYVYADMTGRLPFDDETFDGVVCLEGIEHVLNPFHLLGELTRVCRVGGRMLISTPNIMCMYSRLQFLLSGTFYQFHPAQLAEIGPAEVRDRFHVAPMSYHTLRYLGEYFGARVVKVDGDRLKGRAWLPIYLLILLVGKLWSRRLFFSRRYRANRERNLRIYRQSHSRPALFSRSIILVFEKTRRSTAACACTSHAVVGLPGAAPSLQRPTQGAA